MGRTPSERRIDCGKRQRKLTCSAGLSGTIIDGLATPGSKARNERGRLTVSKFKAAAGRVARRCRLGIEALFGVQLAVSDSGHWSPDLPAFVRGGSR